MIVGEKYSVTYQIIGLHRKPKRFVGVYLGINGLDDRQYNFSLRPEAGTSSVPIESILSASTTMEPCGIKP